MGKGDNRRPRQITEAEWQKRWEMAYGPVTEDSEGSGGLTGETPSCIPQDDSGESGEGKALCFAESVHCCGDAGNGGLRPPRFTDSREGRTQRLLWRANHEPVLEGPGEVHESPDPAEHGD